MRHAHNGIPGHGKLTWKLRPDADGYLVQGSANPEDETSWTPPRVTMKVNGANPGQHHWYRVAAFNSAGQGAWSAPAPRPVM